MAIAVRKKAESLHYQIRGRRRSLAVCGIFAVCASSGFTSSALAVDWDFVPAISLGEVFVDNIDLAPPGFEEEEYLTQAILAFQAAGSSNRLTADINYRMQNLFAARESDRNETNHQLFALATGRILGDSLFIDASALYGQQLIDPDLPSNTNNFFENDNRTDVGALVVSPYLVQTLGRAAELNLRYSKAFVEYTEDQFQDIAIEDAQVDLVNFSVGTPEDSGTRGNWLLRYDAQRTDFDTASEFRYEQAALELGLAIKDAFSIIGIGGLESDLDNDTMSGGLDERFWEAGFRLTGSRNRLELRHGQRFFGNTYFGNWAVDGRRLDFDVSYVEEPTTAASLLAFSLQPVIPETPRDADGFSEPINDAFVRKDLNAEIIYAANRTTLSVNVFDYRTEFITMDESGRTRGIQFQALRRMAPRTRLGLGVEGRRNLSTDNTAASEDYEATARLEHDLGSRTSVSVEVTHLRREPGNQYFANWLILRFDRRFGSADLSPLGNTGGRSGWERGSSTLPRF